MSPDAEVVNAVVLAKSVAMVVLFGASMVCGFTPLLLAKYFRWISPDAAGDLKATNKLVMSLLSFGGGVLLSTTFLHLMPDVQENVEVLQEQGMIPPLEFPLSALLTCVGFFIMYLVEEVVHSYIHRRERRLGAAAPLVRNLSVRRSRPSIPDPLSDTSVTNSIADLIDTNSITKKKDVEAHCLQHGHSHLGSEAVTDALRGLLIVLALSIHELFEGLTVGLEATSSRVWYMLGAVSAHKLVIAFCIGVELIATRTRTCLAFTYITTFAVVSPLGIGAGLLLVGGQGAAAAGVTSVLLQGLASGTLLYVIFFEVWKNDRTGLLQYLAAVLGFAFMFGLQLFTAQYGHSHGGYGGHESHGGADEHASHDHSHEDHSR